MNPEHEDGETRRVVALDAEFFHDLAIVTFSDLETDGRVHKGLLQLGGFGAGLAIGVECLIRFRAGRNPANPGIWHLVTIRVEAAQAQEGSQTRAG